ncbi:MAG: magnesium transporter [Deltaproteobacteria bacterium]|nr:magnesium transporter [Deltaproteobacteria bacterium]
MNTINTAVEKITVTQEPEYFLSDLIGLKVFWNGKKIGKLNDMAILEHMKLPEVTHFIIFRPFGYKQLLVPWDRIRSLDKSGVVIDIESLEKYEGEPPESQVLLRDHVLDKKVIDMDDDEIDVVYDVKLMARGQKLYVTDVDFSKYGLLRRLGLGKVARAIYGLAEVFKKETLSWAYVQPLPEKISSFKGSVKLNVLKEKLPEIHPVDLADILEELNEEQRLVIFNQLETEHASDTLEEIEPRVQRSLISSLDKERVADLIDEMTPAQAADVLGALPTQQAEEILDLMEHDETEKIESLLEKQDDTIVNLTTSLFITFPPNVTVRDIIDGYRHVAPDVDVPMYIYVVDSEGRLRGLVNLQGLLLADPQERLEEVMDAQVISLKPDSTITEAVEMFDRYNFRAIPVVDDDDVILGVLPARDIMKLPHTYK